MGLTRRGKGGGPAGRRALLRLPFLLIALAGLWLLGQGLVIPAKAVLAQVLLDRAFAASLGAHAPVKPWPWADTAPIARLSVPRLGVHRIVLSGGSGQAMAFGPTLLPGSAAPGRRGTAVFAAHRDTHFRFLEKVRTGDEIRIEAINGRVWRYRVTGGRIVGKHGYGISRHAATSSIALVTCWPFGAAEHGPWRYVVTAELLPAAPAAAAAAAA